MAEFEIELEKVAGWASQMDGFSEKLKIQERKVDNIAKQFSYRKNYRGVEQALSTISFELYTCQKQVKQCSDALENIVKSYRDVESEMTTSAASIIKVEDVSGNVLDPISNFINDFSFKISPLINPFGIITSLLFKLFYGNYKESEKNAVGKETFEQIQSVLDGIDSWGEIKEAGIVKDFMGYIGSVAAFYTGDKKDLTGAADWLELSSSSVSLWTTAYEYFKAKGAKGDFFGDAAQRRVAGIGVGGSILGLLGSVVSATDGIADKSWQNITADYIDCSSDVFSVSKSVYKMRHIGDVKSLANIKAGVWSPLDVYGAVAEAGIGTVSQVFRSHEKYYADGKWDLQDTGATGIDMSMAGLYGISHSLTLGMDDVFFGWVDRASGGDGTSNMSYIEKAAEGYKIFAEGTGEFIGTNLRKSIEGWKIAGNFIKDNIINENEMIGGGAAGITIDGIYGLAHNLDFSSNGIRQQACAVFEAMP